MTKINIFYSFCSIFSPKGALLFLYFESKRSTPFTQEGVPKMTKINIYYSFCSIFSPKGALLFLYFETKWSTPFTLEGVPKRPPCIYHSAL